MKKDTKWGSIEIKGLEDGDFNKFPFKELQYIEYSANMKGTGNQFYGKKHNKESLKKIGDSTKNRENGMSGKKHSKKTKELISQKTKLQNRDEISRSVSCFLYKDNSFISDYPSLTFAAKELNINRECARLTAVGKRNHTGGYYFRYKD